MPLQRGWLPIGLDAPFTFIFEGNNYSIKNLYSDRSYDAGLFRMMWGSVSRLQLSGPLTYVRSRTGSAGVLAANLQSSSVHSVFVDGEVRGAKAAGLIAGEFSGRLNGCAVSGRVQAGQNAGGVVGDGGGYGVITACLSVATVESQGNSGGIAGSNMVNVSKSLSMAKVSASGYGYAGAIVGYQSVLDSSYWALGYGPAEGVSDGVLRSGSKGTYLTNLACLGKFGSDSCDALGLYSGWSLTKNGSGGLLWDLSSEAGLPGLNILGRVFRDIDGDGVFDENVPSEPSVQSDNVSGAWKYYLYKKAAEGATLQ